MNDRNDLAASIIAKKLITDAVSAKDERKDLARQMNSSGDVSFRVEARDGTVLGKAGYIGGDQSAKVVDDAAFKAWVVANRPDMIRTIVDPAYVKAVLKDAAKDGDAVDKATGEVIPGIDVYDTDGYVRFEISTEARDRMAALLSASELMALTEAPAPEPEPVFDWSEDE